MFAIFFNLDVILPAVIAKAVFSMSAYLSVNKPNSGSGDVFSVD